jgi:hypothetical protein
MRNLVQLPEYRSFSAARFLREGGYHDKIVGLEPQQPFSPEYMEGYIDATIDNLNKKIWEISVRPWFGPLIAGMFSAAAIGRTDFFGGLYRFYHAALCGQFEFIF